MHVPTHGSNSWFIVHMGLRCADRVKAALTSYWIKGETGTANEGKKGAVNDSTYLHFTFCCLDFGTCRIDDKFIGPKSEID